MRFDTHAYEGYRVPPFYDSMLAKVLVQGADRHEALARARRALRELEIEGVTTTRELFLEILEEPGFREGRYTTAYLDQDAYVGQASEEFAGPVERAYPGLVFDL